MAEAPLEIPPMPEFDLAILQQIFHDENESYERRCQHWNQHAGGQECGQKAIEFMQEYARLWVEEYGNG